MSSGVSPTASSSSEDWDGPLALGAGADAAPSLAQAAAAHAAQPPSREEVLAQLRSLLSSSAAAAPSLAARAGAAATSPLLERLAAAEASRREPGAASARRDDPGLVQQLGPMPRAPAMLKGVALVDELLAVQSSFTTQQWLAQCPAQVVANLSSCSDHGSGPVTPASSVCASTQLLAFPSAAIFSPQGTQVLRQHHPTSPAGAFLARHLESFFDLSRDGARGASPHLSGAEEPLEIYRALTASMAADVQAFAADAAVAALTKAAYGAAAVRVAQFYFAEYCALPPAAALPVHNEACISILVTITSIAAGSTVSHSLAGERSSPDVSSAASGLFATFADALLSRWSALGEPYQLCCARVVLLQAEAAAHTALSGTRSRPTEANAEGKDAIATAAPTDAQDPVSPAPLHRFAHSHGSGGSGGGGIASVTSEGSLRRRR